MITKAGRSISSVRGTFLRPVTCTFWLKTSPADLVLLSYVYHLSHVHFGCRHGDLINHVSLRLQFSRLCSCLSVVFIVLFSEEFGFQHLCDCWTLVPLKSLRVSLNDLVRDRKRKISLMCAEKHIFCPSHF